MPKADVAAIQVNTSEEDQMNTEKLNDWIQIVGIFSVVASLIFVGLELKQSREVAISSQYQERYSASMEFNLIREQSEIQRKLVGEALLNSFGLPAGMDDSTTVDELASQFLYARTVMKAMDNHHFQSISGFLSEESWQAQEETLRYALRQPIYKFVVKHRPDGLRRSFVDICNEILGEIEATAAK